MQAEKNFSLKDQLFNVQTVQHLAECMQAAWPVFSSDEFQQHVLDELPNLELKACINHMSLCLHEQLPDDYSKALPIILNALPAELDPNKTDDDFGRFIYAPWSQYVADYGCTAEDLEASLAALAEITKRFSAEYAIRDFLNAFPAQTLLFLTQCSQDANYHVRRLASEGTRPKLPWGKGLSTDFTEPEPILDALHADQTRFVTRSVANHLNDISKSQPDWVVAKLQQWRGAGLQSAAEMDYITRHALRSLVKQGHGGALALLGFTVEPDILVQDFSMLTPEVTVGSAAEFALEFVSQQAQKLMVDYVLVSPNAKGGTNRKVFKLKQLNLQAGEQVSLRKVHKMKVMTTRRLNLGMHQITLLVNGQATSKLDFVLVAP